MLLVDRDFGYSHEIEAMWKLLDPERLRRMQIHGSEQSLEDVDESNTLALEDLSILMNVVSEHLCLFPRHNDWDV